MEFKDGKLFITDEDIIDTVLTIHLQEGKWMPEKVRLITKDGSPFTYGDSMEDEF